MRRRRSGSVSRVGADGGGTRALTLGILVLAGAFLLLVGLVPDLSRSSDTWSYSLAGGVFLGVAAAVARRRLEQSTAVTICTVIGVALFLARLTALPASTPLERLELEYQAFRGVILLSGAAFIALGKDRGMLVSVLGIAMAVTVLLVRGDAGAVLVQPALLGLIGVGMFRLLAGSIAVARSEAAQAEEAAELAYVDELTQLPNRRQMTVHLRGSTARAMEGGALDAVLLFDLDRFKAINDTHGHDVGDDVLRRVATTVAGVLGSRDVLCRWGGEEFLALLGSRSLDEAVVLAERCRRAIAEDAGGVGVTASFGVSGVRPGDALTDVIRRADRALYRAKSEGRDRVVADGGATL